MAKDPGCKTCGHMYCTFKDCGCTDCKTFDQHEAND